MEREYIAHHISRKNSGHEHLIASMQPEMYSKDYSKHSMDSKDGQPAPEAPKALVAQTEDSRSFRSTRQMPSEALDTCRTRLRRARGLVRPGAVGLLTGVECSRVRDSSCVYLTSFVTTRIRRRTSCSTRKTTRSCFRKTPTVLG